jgi:hypothetical protein
VINFLLDHVLGIYLTGIAASILGVAVFAHYECKDDPPTFTDAANIAGICCALALIWPLAPIGFLLGLIGGWRPWR